MLSNVIKQIGLMLSRILLLRAVPQSVTSCFFLLHITIERPISCELPAVSYSRASSEAWRCIPDPEADKPRLDLACIRECVCMCTCVSQGCHGRLYQCLWSTMLPCAPGPCCGRGQPASQPRDSLVIWQTF